MRSLVLPNLEGGPPRPCAKFPCIHKIIIARREPMACGTSGPKRDAHSGREGREPNLLRVCERTLARIWKRTFRQNHAAGPGATYIACGKLEFAANSTNDRNAEYCRGWPPDFDIPKIRSLLFSSANRMPAPLILPPERFFTILQRLYSLKLSSASISSTSNKRRSTILVTLGSGIT